MKSIVCSLVVCAAIAACEPYTEAEFRAECDQLLDAIDDYECPLETWDEIERVSYSCKVDADKYDQHDAVYEGMIYVNDCLHDYYQRNQECGWERCWN
jgi:hypothetical protein